MKVKMLTGIAGVTWSAKAGDVIEVDSKEGKRFIEAGLAEAVAQKSVDKAEKRKK